MSYPNRFLRTDAAGSYTPPTLVPRPMDFFQLQDRFWRMHNEENFSPVAAMLYSYWLNRFNIGNGPQDRWPGALARKVTQVAADLGLNENTVAKARTELEKRGLVFYRAGNKTRAAQWGLDASAFKIALKNSGQSEGIDLKISGQCEPDNLQMNLKNSGQNGIIDLKISGPYKEENNCSVVKTETPPTPKGGGAGSKKNEGSSSDEKLPSESPSLTSANSGGPAAGAELAEPLRAEARALATTLASNWQISEQKNFQKWAKIFRFCSLLAQAGQLPEVRRQFAAYHAYRLLRGIGSYNLDKYLGHETNLSPEGMPYADGEWCGCDWPATLQEAQQAQNRKETARPTFGPAPTSTAAKGNLLAPQPEKIR
ncbi:hypothetical protein DNI29_19055 [Hymenobacter sediminis]|uniref:hypothetical protein n=1 Tax=Hymenobacter sediminis TaxID=2218621 RepID=UPI000DA64A75|nr:hypothetical protein [Hymenobacter sediminis]RPD45481.1 hypothetical protein DNI29_19055 [Hymenobacter sediminis]